MESLFQCNVSNVDTLSLEPQPPTLDLLLRPNKASQISLLPKSNHVDGSGIGWTS
jgi:hypothetical protein